jgi:hypothetical protein
MKKMKITSIAFLFVLTASTAFAQEFVLKDLEVAGDKLIIHYDLIDSMKDRFYTVSVFSSTDNFVNPIQKLQGDVGLEVPPGKNRKITWAAKEELGAAFNGKVSLEIRGRVFIPFVRFTGFSDYKTLKRTKPYVITWTGGTRQNILNFELYHGKEKLWVLPGVANTGNTKIVIPRSVKPGDDYFFRISDSKNKDEIVNTGTFSLRRKVPLLVKAASLAAIGTAAWLLFQPEEAIKRITDPPKPSTENKE